MLSLLPVSLLLFSLKLNYEGKRFEESLCFCSQKCFFQHYFSMIIYTVPILLISPVFSPARVWTWGRNLRWLAASGSGTDRDMHACTMEQTKDQCQCSGQVWCIPSIQTAQPSCLCPRVPATPAWWGYQPSGIFTSNISLVLWYRYLATKNSAEKSGFI